MVCRIPATHGGGSKEANGDVEICLPRDICVLHIKNDSDLDVLIDCIFPRFNENMSDKNYIASQAILSTLNDCVDVINMKMIGHFHREQNGVS